MENMHEKIAVSTSILCQSMPSECGLVNPLRQLCSWDPCRACLRSPSWIMSCCFSLCSVTFCLIMLRYVAPFCDPFGKRETSGGRDKGVFYHRVRQLRIRAPKTWLLIGSVPAATDSVAKQRTASPVRNALCFWRRRIGGTDRATIRMPQAAAREFQQRILTHHPI